MSRDCVIDLSQTLIRTLTAPRILGLRENMGLKQDITGWNWLRSFTERHSEITLKRIVCLGQDRTEAMNPHFIAMHFAHIKSIMEKYEINHGHQIIIDEELGF